MTTLNVTVVTEARDFPAGTVDTSFHFSLVDSTGTTVDSVFSTDATGVFLNVAPGDYTVNVSKNAQTASTTVSVPVPTVSLQVPVTVTVTLA